MTHRKSTKTVADMAKVTNFSQPYLLLFSRYSRLI